MGFINKDQDSEKALNTRDGGGNKRTNPEELEGHIRETLTVKRVRVPEGLDETFKALGKMQVDSGGQEEGFERGVIVGEVKEDKDLIGNKVSCHGELDGRVDDVKEKNGLGFDLNVDALEAEDGVLELGLQDARVIAEKKKEVIDMSSDKSSGEEDKVTDVDSCRQKLKQIEKGDSNENPNSLSHGLGVMEVEQAVGRTRHTVEEKGKTEVGGTVDPWLTLGNDQFPTSNLQPLRPELKGSNLHREASSPLQQNSSGSSLLNVEKRYSEEEKGKGKVLGNDQFPAPNLQPLRPELNVEKRYFEEEKGKGELLGNDRFPAPNLEPLRPELKGSNLHREASSLLQQAFSGNSLLNVEKRYTAEEKGKGRVTLGNDQFPTPNVQPLRPELKRSNLHQEASSLLQQAFNGSSLLNVDKRYTEEEKGKGKVGSSSNPLLSRATYPYQRINFQPIRPVLTLFGQYQLIGGVATRNTNVAMRNFDIYNDSLARFKREMEDETKKSRDQEQKSLLRVDEQLGNFRGPFSTALKTIRESNLRKSAQQLNEWKPSDNGECRSSSRFVPSLLELSIRVLVENVEGIVSLEPVPHLLRRKLTDALCNSRKMNSHILDLLLEGSPPELHVKECSWLADNQFVKSFKNLDAKDLRVLQLDLCGQVTFDYALRETFARSINSLPNLGIISLKGAARLSDDAVKTLVGSAPSLRSINLSQCSLVTETGINYIADSLGLILRELYLDECPRLDALLIAPALMKFKRLEVLSVSGVQSVCDQFVNDVVTVNMKELNLADCLKLTDYSMMLIGSTCADLRALNISNLEKITDVGIEYLANKCRSIEKLKLNGNRFSDEAIAAFLEVSGQSMKELSLNKVSKVGHNTAISLAKCSKKLISLDLSWCRRISNEALGLIVDCSSSLRLLKLFGCSQINQVFLNGHSNSLVRIVGLSNTRILDNLNILEPEEVLLQYSPLPLPSDI